MSTQLSELLRHVASSAESGNMTVREVLDGCETTATPADLLLLLDAERRRQGLKKYEVAERCGASASMFSKLTSAKNSERVKVATLLTIAVALGILDPQEVATNASAPAKGAEQARRRKVSPRTSRASSKRRTVRAPSHAPQGESRTLVDRQAEGATSEDYSTVALREAAVMLNVPLPSLVDLAEKGFLPGAAWEGGRWGIAPAALVKLIQAKETGDRAEAGMAELRRRLDAVEQANEELKGQVKLIESVRELLLQHRHHGGGSAKQSETRVLDLLPEVWPNHFKPGEPVILGDVLRVFPDASAYSIEFLASTLMFPAPPMDTLMRFAEEWLKIYQSAVKAKERRSAGEPEPTG